jgi:hypothetical protein
MRGGRNMDEGGARTGEGNSGQTPVVTVFTMPRTAPTFGSPRKPQHEQIPLQVSDVAGIEWFDMRLV